MITYNQEKFIGQAIESVLMQQVNFHYEIVIGEDSSTDKTTEIVKKYAEKYPERINALLHPHNLGLQGKNNFIATFKACRGQYIALLEGDDYWTSPQKLQIQVDFLDKYLECAICFHNVLEIYEENSHTPWNYCSPTQKEISMLEDLLYRNFIPTCSVLFRNHLFEELPEWFSKPKMGDWLIHILNAQYGNIGYINKVMGCHRIHSDAIWHSRPLIDQLLDTIEAYEIFDTYFHNNLQYRKIIQSMISKHYLTIAKEYEKIDNLEASHIYFKKAEAVK